MMIRLILIVCLTFLASCASDSSSEGKTTIIFPDIDSLFLSQTKLLSLNEVKVERTAILNQDREQQSMTTDSAFWANEFLLFTDLNLHPSTLRSGYKITKKAQKDGFIYECQRLDSDAPVENMKIYTSENQRIRKVDAKLYIDVYTFKKSTKAELNFGKDGLLNNYHYESEKTTLTGGSTIFAIDLAVDR